jgi:STE24 endopeptidase
MMTYTPLFYVIISLIIFDFIIERGLSYLNTLWMTKPIPAELEGIYNDEQYKKQQQYSKINNRFGLITSLVSFVITLVFLFLQGFAWLNAILSQNITHPLWLGMLFFAILYFALDIIQLPFSIYDTFKIEQQFGFNTTTVKTFITDKLKGYLLAIILGGIIYAAVFWFYTWAGNKFWLYAWGLFTLFSLIMVMFYSNIIVPLFNKQKPLEDGELRDAISEFSVKAGFKLKNIFVIDGSKRSTRANAYFTGLGPQKRIVLYDTLINDLTTNEIVAVLAHEIGHFKKRHIVSGFLLSILQLGIMLYVFSILVSNPALSQALGVSSAQFHIGLVAFAILYSPVSMITGLLMNLVSRRNEYQADTFAANYHHANSLISALKKLAAKNLSNLTPHPFYVWLTYSHPSLYQRVKHLISYNSD